MKITDDFNWETYPQHYEGEIHDNLNKHGNPMLLKNFIILNGELVIEDNLHENWKEIHNQIFKLKVKSIFECDCGSAHGLMNNQKINPNLIVNGCDYSQSQIDLGHVYWGLGNYEFAKRLKVVDMTNVEDISSLGKHEFVYTQAVTMHLAYERAKKFLFNMKELSNKYIFLVENVTFHDYNALIAEVFPEFERIIDYKYINYGILLKRK